MTTDYHRLAINCFGLLLQTLPYLQPYIQNPWDEPTHPTPLSLHTFYYYYNTRFNQGEQGNGQVGVRLVLLARGTAFNVFADVLCETQSPEFSSDELAGFEVPWVTGGFVVMTAGEDGTA